MLTVKAKIGKGDKAGENATVNYDFGDNLDASVALFGKEIVHAIFIEQSVVKLQAVMRSLLTKGKKQEEIAAEVANWKLGTTRARMMDPVKAFEALPQDKQKAYIDHLKALMASKKAVV